MSIQNETARRLAIRTGLTDAACQRWLRKCRIDNFADLKERYRTHSYVECLRRAFSEIEYAAYSNGEANV